MRLVYGACGCHKGQKARAPVTCMLRVSYSCAVIDCVVWDFVFKFSSLVTTSKLTDKSVGDTITDSWVIDKQLSDRKSDNKQQAHRYPGGKQPGSRQPGSRQPSDKHSGDMQDSQPAYCLLQCRCVRIAMSILTMRAAPWATTQV